MKNLKPTERELIKLTSFFKKRAEELILQGSLNEEEQQVTTACQNLADSIFKHAENREAVLEKRRQLGAIVKDNAACPKCEKATFLKFNGIATNELGWKSNKYKCRRCNITFTWNRPNNPWDLVPFLKQVIVELDHNSKDEALPPQTRENAAYNRDMMVDNLARLEPVLQASDVELADMETREREMAKLMHEFKNYLLIEKIKMNKWVEPEN